MKVRWFLLAGFLLLCSTAPAEEPPFRGLVTGDRVHVRAGPGLSYEILLTLEKRARVEVVAGIAQHYRPEDLAGRLVVVVNNLEPAVIRGVTSQGMVLAAVDGETLTVVSPERPVSPGSVVR
ncbi:MAG: hypothetical protein HYZ95_03845 [Candidatus Omnitrophica bacterium]|nr:hypothetical protein [Candidatus Omnitrophota bacterium]